MNATLNTTGLTPLVVGSVEKFQLQAFTNNLPWDLTGGTVNLLVADPSGTVTTYPATIAGGGAYYNFTIVGPAGSWARAWSCVDSSGIKQISRPIPFNVVTSPA